MTAADTRECPVKCQKGFILFMAGLLKQGKRKRGGKRRKRKRKEKNEKRKEKRKWNITPGWEIDNPGKVAFSLLLSCFHSLVIIVYTHLEHCAFTNLELSTTPAFLCKVFSHASCGAARQIIMDCNQH
jgi:hypothetical protein